MRRETPTSRPAAVEARVRRGYFECRYGQLHVHNSIPPGGGFEEATPLLCLHDSPGSGRVFTRFLTFAGRDRSVYAPDLPGCGESDPPQSVPLIADYADAIGDFLDSMRLRRIDVLGQGAGGLVGGELALIRPGQIGRLILVSGPSLTSGEPRQPVRTAPPSGTLDGGEHGADGRARLTAAAAQYPQRERLALLGQRLLLLRPRDDHREPSGRLREFLPGARLLDMEPSAEELFGTAAARAADVVREFLQG
ncbi:MAG TPA: alpha/beta hydrolase [Steroidobacteraceae bacterium]|nr:alpha/beta hydrolase [Steroidobacteraceae bacterium]